MRKIGTLFVIVLISIISASLFGILHNEITLTISPEYFTKFQLIKFHTGDAVPYEIGAAYVGLISTWWMGLIIGIVLGIQSLRFSNHTSIFKNHLKALGIVFITTVAMAFIGFIIGKCYHGNHLPQGIYFQNIINKPAFTTVAIIHDSSYLGGCTGLILALIFIRKQLAQQ